MCFKQVTKTSYVLCGHSYAEPPEGEKVRSDESVVSLNFSSITYEWFRWTVAAGFVACQRSIRKTAFEASIFV